MRENRQIAVLSFTDAYEKQEFYEEMERDGWNISRIFCRGLEGTNCYCDAAAAEQIRERIRPFGASGLHFLDSGNYHYVSRLWLELVTEPFDLLVFDHHTDMQEPAFGGILSCGGWVRAALEELPLLCKVYLAGPPGSSPEAAGETEEFAGRVIWIREEELGRGEGLEEMLKGTGCKEGSESGKADSLPLYISADKDILKQEDAMTNWDQGQVGLDELLACIRGACRVRRVIGMDVCGEASGEETAEKRNDRANRALCRVFADGTAASKRAKRNF